MKTPNFLLVGDVHATVSELEDCRNLINYIKVIAYDRDIDYVVFLGDQSHNHAVLNVHVLNFWKEALSAIRPLVKDIICLVGNHDLPGITGQTNINSMSTLDHMALVVDDNIIIEDILFVGYKSKNEDFIKICNNNPEIKTVICHQTFDGACYENGFLATDGIKFEDLPQDQRYISGHIHTPSVFGRVQYVGAPRWRTLSDANIKRKLVKFNTTDGIKESFDTGYACKRIVSKDIVYGKNEEDIGTISIHNPKELCYINLIGPQAWIDKERDFLGNSVIVKCFPTDTKTIQVRESEGIDKALIRFIESSTVETPKEVLKKLVEERVWKR